MNTKISLNEFCDRVWNGANDIDTTSNCDWYVSSIGTTSDNDYILHLTSNKTFDETESGLTQSIVIPSAKLSNITKKKPTEKEQRYLDVMAENGYSWCAKDKDHECWFFSKSPIKSNVGWEPISDDKLFTKSAVELPFLSWYDDEPYYTKAKEQQ